MRGWNLKQVPYFFGFLFVCTALDITIRVWKPIPVTCNPGIAFGIKLPEMIIFGLSFSLLLVALCQSNKVSQKWNKIAWLCIFIGGMTNVLDRIFHGCVIDYIAFPLFPSFNLADMILFLGAAFLIVRMMVFLPTSKEYVR